MMDAIRSDVSIPVPPDDFVRAVGGSDFRITGEVLANMIVKHGGLKRNHRVLDIGSGCGRVSAALTSYLTPEGQYEGLDIVKPMVDWCNENISTKYRNFRFHHVNLTNTHYSKDSGSQAALYKFEFPNNHFDFIFLSSVFTHLFASGIENYLGEIGRMLKPDGKMLATFFLIDDDYQQKIDLNKLIIKFDHEIDENCRAYNSEDPEEIIAYKSGFALDMIRKAGLSIEQVSDGGWKHGGGWCFQDTVIAKKVSSPG